MSTACRRRFRRRREMSPVGDLLRDVRLLVFDADDTLRRTTVPGQPCPRAPEEWALLPGVRDTLSAVDWSRVQLGIASNQDQVGYGFLTAGTAERLLRDLVHAATDGRVTDPLIRFCPHPLEMACHCRKPAPGMLFDLIAMAGAAADAALFVGNAAVDREAAARAGVRFVVAGEFFGPARAAAGDGSSA